jgi:hypothetical protein
VNNLIQFYPWGSGAKASSLPPSPAKNNLADYWKDMPRFHNEGDYEKFKDGTASRSNVFLSMKHCMPYYDAMTCGYHYLLHTDIAVTLDENKVPKLSWDSPMEPAGDRVLKEMPVPHGHYQAHFGWQMHWGIQMPEGWSALITHPINRYDLPFTTVSGLADYDVYPLPGNVSFHIKDNFEGLIKAGTPLLSIIPIKREDWNHTINDDQGFFDNKVELIQEKESVPMSHYKKKYRQGMRFD